MSGADRRHAVGVARRVCAALGGDDVPAPVAAAALLHDVGKLASGLGTCGRVGATVVAVAGRERVSSWSGPVGRYVRHPELGAALLEEAGSDPLTVAWAREHHSPSSAWTVPAGIAHVLKAADD
jgi:hypothetical protein